MCNKYLQIKNVIWGWGDQFSRSVVSDSATPWTVARQASLSITNPRSLLVLMSTESVMPSNRRRHPSYNLSQHQGICQ